MQSRLCRAQAQIALINADPVIEKFCEHMVEHNAVISAGPSGPRLRLGDVEALFSRRGSDVLVEVVAPDLESLHFARMSVASHILEFSGSDRPAIRWTGDGDKIDRPPNFQVLEVVTCRTLTPHMRRLTFSGENVQRFARLDALHVNLMIQQENGDGPQWPRVGSAGIIEWERPDLRPDMRKYTVRSVDTVAGTIDIDFVLHDDAGPGARLAATAVPGDRIGVLGPGGGGLVAADWYLFAGDETALPAIARMLESLPALAQGHVFIEVEDAAEIQPLSVPDSVSVEWLLREGRSAETTSLLVEAVRATVFPDDGRRRYVWAGCEFEAFRALRNHVRRDRQLRNDEHLIVSYWRRGASEAE